MNNQKNIYCANPGAEFLEDREDLLKIIDITLTRGSYILGQEVEQFEKNFANYLGVKDCIGVANGTDAIVLALRGLDIGVGSEVITVSHTAVASVAAIEQVGAIPVLADIDPRTRCMCPKSFESLITPKVKAVLVVHIYGQAAQINEILRIAKQHNISVIEDCAQAHGALFAEQKVGSFADIAAFSFYPTKNLGALGDGGAVAVKDNAELTNRIKALRQYGWEERYISKFPGINSRLDELQAAILNYRLNKLDTRNNRRREIAKFYTESLSNKDIETPLEIPNTKHVMHQYVIATEHRLKLKDYLANKGVFAAMHYPQAVHQQPAYLNRLRGASELKQTETFYTKLLSLPMYPQLLDTEVEYIGKLLKDF